jgi:hypothetical protein
MISSSTCATVILNPKELLRNSGIYGRNSTRSGKECQNIIAKYNLRAR